ncbi:MAG: alpha/beta hydrolase [Salinivirgaceae bacterium]|nr:alpha/beta hydrolase [Salinivirgaceae bacterium]
MKVRILSVAAMATCITISAAQTANAQFPGMPAPKEPQKIIKLWDGKIPGAKNVDENKPDEVGTNAFFARDVKVPSIAYYPADENPTGTAIVVCPGGGYAGLTYTFEGVSQATWLNSIGISAFVLRYRLPKDEFMEKRCDAPLQDAQQAVRYVRSHAKEYGINPDHIGIMGFSAGGHLASVASTHFNDEVYKTAENVSARPDFSVLVYPVITMEPSFTHEGSREALIGLDADQALTDRFSSEKQVTKETPPAFLVHALDDNLVPYSNSISYANAMREKGVECELHLYARGDHGLRAKPNETQSFWHDACEKWLRMNGWTK